MTEGRWGPEISLKQKNTKGSGGGVGGGGGSGQWWTILKYPFGRRLLTERVKNIPSAM